jgi:head-tail adaptor
MSVFESLLNLQYTITRRERVSDGQGGWAVTYGLLATVPGRMRPASSAEREAAAQDQRRISHVLYVLPTVDIARGDQVDGDGITVNVVGIREPSRAGHHLEVDCWEGQLEVDTEAGT